MNNKINPDSKIEVDNHEETAPKRTPQELKLDAIKQKEIITKKLERSLVATKEHRVRACMALFWLTFPCIGAMHAFPAVFIGFGS